MFMKIARPLDDTIWPGAFSKVRSQARIVNSRAREAEKSVGVVRNFSWIRAR